MTDTTDILADLDFTATPTCECHGGGGCETGHDKPCGAPAAWFLRVHMFGGCRHPSVALTGGMATHYACQSCYGQRAALVDRLREHAERAFHVFGRPMICGGCDRPVTDPGMWQAIELGKGVSNGG